MKISIKAAIAAVITGAPAFGAASGGAADAGKIIPVLTDNTALVLRVGDNGRLYQTYLGERLDDSAEYAHMPWHRHAGTDGSVSRRGWEAYSTLGNEDYFEPALGVIQADGNQSACLYYAGSEQQQFADSTVTRIDLRDDKYPLEVTLHYVAYPKQNVIKTWTDIRNTGKKPVTLSSYASAMLYFSEPEYYLTEFSGDWAHEATMSSQQLQFGKKVIDTKLGSRAGMHTSPFFEVGLGAPVSEDHGEVLLGTLGWTGNFRFTFEVDNVGALRVIPGINPTASAYDLGAKETFATPEFIFTLSYEGAGDASRNMHAWARNHSLKDGLGSRMTLLNNWENTYFKFDQQKLGALMHDARELGVDLFLLDDGWFGNKYPRKDDHAGLGDWEVTHDKLPGGIQALIDSARNAGVKFGIWIEPEMVNPKSELYEKHPEWAIEQPNRETIYYRNQLVLDLSNPEVQDYVFGVVDRLLTDNPDIAYFKWDCNSPITNIYSSYEGKRQNRLYVDHVRGLYKILDRVRTKYPEVPMMLCSGGGARCDYEVLKYFTEFWASDNTNPLDRIYIQWGFSQLFPAKAIAAHVTDWNRQASVKFRTDVASMCKLGFDIGLKKLSADERKFMAQAAGNWKRLQPAIMDGEQYRLVSPYESEHAVVQYVDSSKDKGVVFAYNLSPRFGEPQRRVRLRGLEPSRKYRVEEINLMPGAKPTFAQHGEEFSGDYLMKVGLELTRHQRNTSSVVELTAL